MLTALLDACVLYPAPLRDLLVWLAVEDAYRARWSSSIHEEWVRSVLEQRPDLTRARLERTCKLMNEHARDSLVEGFEHLIEDLVLPDPGDRHVLAAAITGGANTIVTFNLRHFPKRGLSKYGIEPLHPDVFVGRLLDDDIPKVVTAFELQRATLKNPPQTREQLMETLERQGMMRSVARLRELIPPMN